MARATKRPDLLPFLKWAGGKRWLVDRFPEFFELGNARYVEPFLGSGAVFFRLAPSSALLSDTNAELINAYRCIRSRPDLVRRHLASHQLQHCHEHYYVTRQRQTRSRYTAAARFIYLNRTCWNGLYRVNLKGEFNVPIGSKVNVLLDSDNFRLIAGQLAAATIKEDDFEATLKDCGEGDFVYCDPPYTVQHNYNGFVKYNEKLFSWGDQIRLRDCVAKASARGARVLVSNACHKSLLDLYDGVGKITKIDRCSVISGLPAGRGKYEEMVVECL